MHRVAIGNVEVVSSESQDVELTLRNRLSVRLERPITPRRSRAFQHVEEIDADLTGRPGHHDARRATHDGSAS
jgi:hypothetical protein